MGASRIGWAAASVALVAVAFPGPSVGAQVPGAATASGAEVLATPQDRKVPIYGVAESVACPQGGGCVAAGSYVEDGGGVAALTWFRASGRWHAAYRVDLPPGMPATTPSSFDGVACAAASRCVVVGTANVGTSTGHPIGTVAEIAERVVGRVSRAVAVSLPTGDHGLPYGSATSDIFPTPAWCEPGGSTCVIVGSALDAAGALHGFTAQAALGHAGSGWLTASSSLPFAAPAAPYEHWSDELVLGISCIDVRDCVVVGTVGLSVKGAQGDGEKSRPFAQSELHGVWGRPQVLPLPASASTVPLATLSSVTCVPATVSAPGSCLAVGSYQQATYESRPLVERYANSSWQLGTLPSVSALPARYGLLFVSLNSVSCSSYDTCVTGGSVFSSENTTTERTYAIDATGRMTGFGSVLATAGVPPIAGRAPAATVIRGLSCAPGQASCTVVGLEQGVGSLGTAPFVLSISH